MPKKVSEAHKEKILESFVNGLEIKDIANEYNFSPSTITKQLKLLLGEKKYNEIKKSISNTNKKLFDEKILSKKEENSKIEAEESFFEIVPITTGIELEIQKELSSQPLKDVNLPSIVYMLVDKKVELIPKLLSDYPEWSFLSEDDLKRKTIEIFSDLKVAKRKCNRDEKVIKVPNPDIFRIVAPILLSKGITRIINEDKLISI